MFLTFTWRITCRSQAEVIFSHRSNKRRVVSIVHLIGRWNEARALETLEANHRDTTKALAEWQREMDTVEPETAAWSTEEVTFTNDRDSDSR